MCQPEGKNGVPEPSADRDKGHAVEDCPLYLEVCYPSCYFWRGRCAYNDVISKMRYENSG